MVSHRGAKSAYSLNYFRRSDPLRSNAMRFIPYNRTMPARVIFSLLLLCCCAHAGASGRTIEYARDVLPILSANCYHCHGPDEEARQMELRFDTREGAFRKDDVGGVVIVPGDVNKSELVRRVVSSDPDSVMPPA